jgi:hypothetical protein
MAQAGIKAERGPNGWLDGFLHGRHPSAAVSRTAGWIARYGRCLPRTALEHRPRRSTGQWPQRELLSRALLVSLIIDRHMGSIDTNYELNRLPPTRLMADQAAAVSLRPCHPEILSIYESTSLLAARNSAPTLRRWAIASAE